MSNASHLKQKLLAALQSQTESKVEAINTFATRPTASNTTDEEPLDLKPGEQWLGNGQSAYSLLVEEELDTPLPPALAGSAVRLRAEVTQMQQGFTIAEDVPGVEKTHKLHFDDTLSMRDHKPTGQVENLRSKGKPLSQTKTQNQVSKTVKSESVISGGSMADLSGYRDLSKAPMSFGDEDMPVSTLSAETSTFERSISLSAAAPQQHFQQEMTAEVDTEFSGNVKTLIRLVNELPEGVTKQTGAQIIRLTMEAMGISMEDVLSEAQSAQSEMLDAVRANIKKIEEYKTVIRKLETDIKYYQGKANELSEIIDLFILSNTSGQRLPSSDDLPQ